MMVERNFNLKIERGIPFPSSKTHPSRYEKGTARWLAKKMKVGDSVLVSTSGQATTLARELSNEHKTQPYQHVSTYRREGDKFRVWRKS